MKLEMAILAGDESKKFLAGFTEQLDRFEKLLGLTNELAESIEGATKKMKAKAKEAIAETAVPEDDEEEFAAKPPKKGKKAAVKTAAFDEDEDEETDESEPAEDDDEDEDGNAADFDEDEDEDEDDEETEEAAAPVKKKGPGRPKNPTLDEVNDACKRRAAGGKRAEVLAILKKNFKTQTVSELKPDQYKACIEAMAV